MAEVRSISEIIENVVPYYKKKGGPDAEHKLVYESYAETLEPVYYFVIDLMKDFGLDPEKLVDNFISSPGSGHFLEISQRKSLLQQQGFKIMADINTIVRSILNVIYDLRDFKIRLQSYDDLNSKDKAVKNAARLSVKQIWLDKVDIQKGNSSVKAMALGQAGFQTLLDAFLAVEDEKDVKKLDLNDKVKRIVLPRIQEFNIWLEQSEKELRKRYELQRTYLKSQVNSLKLYSRWAKPYLRLAQQLEMKDSRRNPELINVFNRILLELTLFGKSKLKVKDSALTGDLPSDFQKLKLKRDYYSCVLIDFVFRAVPQQGSLIGKSEITFKSYSLNEDELAKIYEEFDKSDFDEVLGLVEGTAGESMEHLQEEIDEFLEESEKRKVQRFRDESNPFLALFGYYDKPSKTEEKPKKTKPKTGPLRKDDWIERTHLRPLAASKAEDMCFKLFDIYKKAHGMVSYT